MVSRPITRRRRSRGFAKSNRQFLWVPFRTIATALTVAAGQTTLSVDLLGLYFTDTGREIPVGTTITRIRGNLLLTQVDADFQDVVVTVGLHVAEESSDYVEILTTEITDPIWRMDYVGIFRATEVSAGAFNVEGKTFPIDTKSKRKLHNAERLQLVGDLVSSTANADLNVSSTGVILLQMP